MFNIVSVIWGGSREKVNKRCREQALVAYSTEVIVGGQCGS